MRAIACARAHPQAEVGALAKALLRRAHRLRLVPPAGRRIARGRVVGWQPAARGLEDVPRTDRDPLDRLPLPLRLTARLAPFLVRRQASHYRLNLTTVDG